MTKVVNKYVESYTVWCGRTKDTYHFGNPWAFKSGTSASLIVENRKTAVNNYEKWLRGKDFADIEPERRKWILDNIHRLRGEILGCVCKPALCHCDILVKLIEETNHTTTSNDGTND